MKIKPLRTAQPAIRGGPPLDGDLYRWLASLMTAVQLAVPPKGIVLASLTAAEVSANFDGTGLGNSPGKYEGWAICNGNNGTPSLDGRFPRFEVSAAGGTGGSDSSAHTHAIDHDHGSFTSAAESGHTHAIDHDHGSFTSGAGSAHSHGVGTLANAAESSHTHGEGSYTADIALAGSAFIFANLTGAGTFTATNKQEVTAAAVSDSSAGLTGSNVSGTSAAGSSHNHTISGSTATEAAHTHAVDVPGLTGTSGASSGHTHAVDVPSIAATSGAASATDNRPAYYELVPLMRLEVG